MSQVMIPSRRKVMLGAPLVQISLPEARILLLDDLLQLVEVPKEGPQVVQEAAPESGVKFQEQ
jgi:hypothetical protein